jgi:MFS family permease
MTPECFPGDIRGSALSICSSANRIGTIVGPLVAGLILSSYSGVFYAVILFGFTCLLGATSAFFLKETKEQNADLGLAVHS